MTSLGGRTVRLWERDGDGPPIVLIAGCGLAMDFWRDVADLLPRARLVSYDRPGIGGTRWPGTLPRLADEQATLVDLLERLGAPAVLVAHSMASFIVEAVTRIRPELVAGVVMVDGSVEWPVTPPRHLTPRLAQWVERATEGSTMGALGAFVWHVGTWFQSTREFRHLHGGRLADIYADTDTLAAATAESLAYGRQAWDLIEVRRAHAWPDRPTVVLTAADNRWLASQRRWANMLGAGHLVVTGSKHLMMLDRPDAIVEAVEELRR
ncbi:alpha/beta fold hydrolase [Aestuariimicrobium soli]|uniref:alpha/beta fold hydrolase n=1 Tax=Aestuariimicrobium soli TaxID=2035834 RepID=UPI003EBD0E66